MLPLALHRALDKAAMSVENLYRRAPEPFRPGPSGSPVAWEDLGPLPEPPCLRGTWSAPSPAPFDSDRLRLHVTPAAARRRGTAILVPPWKIPKRWLLSRWNRMLVKAGFDTWLFVPPHHLERALPGSRSGEGFVSVDLGRFRSALAQTVLELRLCAALAAARGPTALVGLSLGALAAAWVATGPEPVDAAALVGAPADLAAVFQETPIGARYARMAARALAPLPEAAKLKSQLQPLAPLHRWPTAHHLFIAGGSADAIALRGPEALARAWDLPFRTYPRGHMSLLFACKALRREVRNFLASSVAT